MRAFGWMQDLGRSAGGKVVALLLALAMVFSYSNIFVYSAKAFAVDEGSEVTTEETTETTEEVKTPEVDDTDDETTETENDTPEGDTDETTNDVVEGEEGSEGEEDSDDQTEEQTLAIYECTVEDITATWNPETSAITISGHSVLTKEVLNKFSFTNDEGEEIDWKPIVKQITVKGDEQDKISLAPCVSGNHHQPFSKNDELGSQTGYSLTLIDVDNIPAESFYHSHNIKSVVLTNVGTIERSAFFNCPSIASAVITTTGEIGSSVFTGCTSLTTCTINNASKINRGVFTNYGDSFDACINLNTVSIKNVGNIASNAFEKCSGLTNVNIEDVTTVGEYAFTNLSSINTVTLKNIGSIEKQAFAKCSGIANLTMNDVRNVGDNAFWNCTGLKNVVIERVTFLDSDYPPFHTTGALDEFGNPSMTLTVKDSTLGKNAFYNCTGLKTLIVENVDTIGTYAFRNCTGLKTVEMSGVNVIDNYAFWNCKNLESIDSLAGVSSIGGFTFYGCESLKGLTIDDLAKMGYVGSNEEIMKRVEAILAGKFNLDNAENIGELELDQDNWLVGDIGQSSNWQEYDNGTQIMQQARWSDAESGVAEVQVDAYYTGEKQMDYIFIADLSASMAQLGNPNDMNARFYDMQSKLLDMTSKLLNTPGYDCQVAIAWFGGEFNGTESADVSNFFTDADSVKEYIQKLEPLYENTNYYMGLKKAYTTAQLNKGNGRNTVVVFLSDGAPNRGPSDDIAGESVAQQYKDLGIDIYGVLHSPAASQHDKALGIMNKICDQVYESTNTQEFGEAMNKAFTAVYGNNTITIPVNAEDFDVTNLSVTAGEVSYNDGIITWTLNGMPFTDHKLTYNLTLKEENANRVGTYTYSINNGNAAFTNENSAAAGIDLEISRTVEETIEPPAPVVPPTNPTVPTAPTTPTTPATVTPAAPATPAAVTPATPAAPVEAAPIEDDATPMAQSATGSTEESISDDENPLASVYDVPHCWIHYLIMLGMVLSVIYFAAVAIRRTSNDRKMGELERKLTEDREISYSASPAKHQA